MLRSPQKSPSRRAANAFDVAETWPDETIVVLPETPRVRLSPRRKMMPQTPGWPPATDMGDTIRMYHDSETEDEGHHTLNFAMNQDFIESRDPLHPAPRFAGVDGRYAFVYSDGVAGESQYAVSCETGTGTGSP
jgi:hypothetical protein